MTTLAAPTVSVERAVRHVIDPEAFRGVKPEIGQTRELPLGTVLVDPADKNRMILAYLPYVAVGDRDLRRLATDVSVPVSARTAGLKVRSLTFGSLPRLELRGRDACSAAGINKEHPGLFSLLGAQAAPLEKLYARLDPAVFTRHAAEAANILDSWRLPHSQVFTGGVLNRDSNIGYHFDTGNFSDVFSAMICLRRGMDGGALVLPELGIHLPIADNTVAFFDGQAALHGVTDLSRRSVDGYRVTVVYYSTRRLWACLPPDSELDRAQTKRTERAVRRAGLE